MAMLHDASTTCDSQESDEEFAAETGNFKMGWFNSFGQIFVNYQTNKRVVIRSPYLQIPNVCLMVTITIYIICFQMIWKLSFFFKESVYGNGLGVLEKPMANWATCTDLDADCNMKRWPTEPAYCQNVSFGEISMNGQKTARNITGCWSDDSHEPIASTFFIPTMYTWIRQSWEPGSSQDDWFNDQIIEQYAENIEEYTTRVSHSFKAAKSGVSGNMYNMQGFIRSEEWSDTKKQKIPCYQSDSEDGTCLSSTKSVSERLQAQDVCGSSSYFQDLQNRRESGTRGESCFSSEWGDIIGVRTLLNVAGISLDDAGMENLTLRQSGLGLEIEVEYENLDYVFGRLFDGTSFVRPPAHYTYTVKKMETFGSHVVQETKVRYGIDKEGNVNPYKRTLFRKTGIFVRITTGGQVGIASPAQFAVALASAFALLKLANLFVEMILIRIYRQCAGTKHISHLWAVYKEQHSPNDDDFKQLVQTKLRRRTETLEDITDDHRLNLVGDVKRVWSKPLVQP